MSKRTTHKRGQSEVSRFFQFLKSPERERHKKTRSNEEMDAEALTAEESLSRMLHNPKPKSKVPNRGPIFDHFIVVGIENHKSNTPKILFEYPANKRSNFTGLEDFCFPQGVETRELPVSVCKSELLELTHNKKYLQHPEHTFVFLLTDEASNTHFGVCVHKQELLEDPPCFVSTVSCPPDYHAETTRCYCLISRFPFFRFHLDFIFSLFALDHLTRLEVRKPTIEYKEAEADSPIKEKSPNTVRLVSSRGNRPQLLRRSSSDLYDPDLKKLRSSTRTLCENLKPDLTSSSDSTATAESTPLHDEHFDFPVSTSANSFMNVQSIHSISNNVMSSANSTSRLTASVGVRVMDYDELTIDLSAMDPLGSRPSSASPRLSNNASPRLSSPREYKSPILATIYDESPFSDEETAPNMLFEDRFHLDQILDKKPASPTQSHPNALSSGRRRSRLNQSTGGIMVSGGLQSADSSSSNPSVANQTDNDGHTLHRRKSGLPFVSRAEQESAKMNPCVEGMEKYYQMKIPVKGRNTVFSVSPFLTPLQFERPFYDESEELFAEWGLPLAFYNVSFSVLITLLSAILLEKKIVVYSNNLRYLSAIVLAITPLIRPFVYQSVIIPMLPEKMPHLLEAPVPFVVGMASIPPYDQIPSDVIVFNVSKKHFQTSETIPILPNVAGLKKKCDGYLKDLAQTFKKEIPFRTTKEQLGLVHNISTVFEAHLDSLFANFHNYTICNKSDPTRPITVFMKESFLEDIPEQMRSFIAPFLDTQMFFHYSDKRLRKRDSAVQINLPGTGYS